MKRFVERRLTMSGVWYTLNLPLGFKLIVRDVPTGRTIEYTDPDDLGFWMRQRLDAITREFEFLE